MLLLACLAMPLFGDPATVKGTVITGGSPLPGCTVTFGSHKTVTDANGSYTFRGVEPAIYDVKYEMESFEKAWRTISVTEGLDVVPPQELKIVTVTETLTLGGCSMPCTLSEQPATPLERPSCVDYDVDEALIRALEQNERSALELLKQRHDTTFTIDEKHRIANALLHHVENDSRYWNEIYEHAENADGFVSDDFKPTPECIKWCAERDLDPVAYLSITTNAFIIAGADSRSHDLMIRALASKSPDIAALSIMGLGMQHDETSLELIAKTIDRFPSEAHEMLAFSLSAYHSDAADAVALRYLPELDDNYKQARDEPQH